MGRGAEVRTNASGGEVGVESGVGCCSSGPRCGAGLAQLPPSLQREGLALRVPGEQVPLASGAAVSWMSLGPTRDRLHWHFGCVGKQAYLIV